MFRRHCSSISSRLEGPFPFYFFVSVVLWRGFGGRGGKKAEIFVFEEKDWPWWGIAGLATGERLDDWGGLFSDA